jgi:RcsF protein
MTLKTHTLLLAAILLALGGCSANFAFHTNLDPENFSNYYAPTSVKVFDDEQEFTGVYQFIGAVEGMSCQHQVNDVPASEVQARTAARRSAAKLNANAIIFTGCSSEKSANCHQEAVCYGMAYLIQVDKQ